MLCHERILHSPEAAIPGGPAQLAGRGDMPSASLVGWRLPTVRSQKALEADGSHCHAFLLLIEQQCAGIWGIHPIFGPGALNAHFSSGPPSFCTNLKPSSGLPGAERSVMTSGARDARGPRTDMLGGGSPDVQAGVEAAVVSAHVPTCAVETWGRTPLPCSVSWGQLQHCDSIHHGPGRAGGACPQGRADVRRNYASQAAFRGWGTSPPCMCLRRLCVFRSDSCSGE